MSAQFERAQKTKIMITSVPVTADEMASATWLELSCTIKQASFTAGQKAQVFLARPICDTSAPSAQNIFPAVLQVARI